MINFDNSASQKYVVQTASSIRMARSEITGYSFLVIKKSNKLYFETSTWKLLSVNNFANSYCAYNGRGVAF